MKRIFILIIFSFFISGCELFVIGEEKPAPVVIDLNQNSSLGTVYLFKAELDSNNIPGATDLLAKPDGSRYLALERYEMWWDVARFARMINNLQVTMIKTDTVGSADLRQKIEMNYLYNLNFNTVRINDIWYITNYDMKKEKF